MPYLKLRLLGISALSCYFGFACCVAAIVLAAFAALFLPQSITSRGNIHWHILAGIVFVVCQLALRKIIIAGLENRDTSNRQLIIDRFVAIISFSGAYVLTYIILWQLLDHIIIG